MNKALLGLALIIIIGVGVYFVLQPKGAGVPTNTTGAANGMMGQSLGQLAAAGQPVTCTFATTTAAGTTEGTVYVANGMVAGSFIMSGMRMGNIDSHMLVRDNTSYVWTSMSNTGFKSTVSSSNAPASDNKGVDYNAPMDYRCSAWTVDPSKFNLPANISFMTTASYTPPSQGAGATGAAPTGGVKGTAAQCAQCNALPSAQKAQCLAALQC